MPARKRRKIHHPNLGTQPLERISDCQFNADDLLTPKMFAKIVGTTDSNLANEHKRGYFKAAFCDSNGGRSKERRYTVQQIHLYRSRKSIVEFVDEYSGAQAQQCFRLFDEGKGVKECIRDLGIHPKTVERIRDEWFRCDGGVFLTQEHLDLIHSMPHDGPDKITRGEEIVDILSSAVEDARCVECLKRARVVCLSCANKRLRGTITETKSAAE